MRVAASSSIHMEWRVDPRIVGHYLPIQCLQTTFNAATCTYNHIHACGNHDLVCSIAATNDYHHYIPLLPMITNDSWLIISDKCCSSMTRFASARGTWKKNTNEETKWCEGWTYMKMEDSKIQLSFPGTMSVDWDFSILMKASDPFKLGFPDAFDTAHAVLLVPGLVPELSWATTCKFK